MIDLLCRDEITIACLNNLMSVFLLFFYYFFFSFLVFTFAVDVDHASHNRQCSATTCFLQLWIYAVFD